MRILLCLLLVFIAGCVSVPARSGSAVHDSGAETLTNIVQTTDWLITASILATGLGAFAFLNGSSVGLKLMSAALIVLSLTLAVARFSLILAVFAVCAAVCLLGYTIWTKSTAIREIVAGNEDWKSNATGGNLATLPDTWKICQRRAQEHKSTEKIVDAYKLSLGKSKDK